MSEGQEVDIEPFGERGALIRFSGFTDDIESGLYANVIAKALRVQPGVSDAVAGIDSIALRFSDGRASVEDARRAFANAAATAKPQAAPAKQIEIPVLYGGEAGPDFDDLCARADMTPSQLVEAHSAQRYRVVTIGFAPGFAYLGPLEERLRAPRLVTPRPHLAAGSVGVAGAFTGVYSLPSPGGWRIIGRTPVALFDKASATPFIFEPGAEVRFLPIAKEKFDVLHERTR